MTPRATYATSNTKGCSFLSLLTDIPSICNLNPRPLQQLISSEQSLVFMSSTEQPTSSSSSNNQLIIAALADYAKLTGIDLSKSPYSERFKLLDSPPAILELLEEQVTAFKEYRNRNRKLIGCISPVVKVLHAFSGTLGEGVGLVSNTCHRVNLLS
jgi:hypothetical protein